MGTSDLAKRKSTLAIKRLCYYVMSLATTNSSGLRTYYTWPIAVARLKSGEFKKKGW